MPSTAIQYIAVSRKRLEVGELFEKVDLRKEIHLEHSCRSLARMEHYTSNASLARERILAAVMRSSRVFSRWTSWSSSRSRMRALCSCDFETPIERPNIPAIS